jgi:hypothetical protein
MDHEVPFHVKALPPLSTAAQKVVLAHDTKLGEPVVSKFVADQLVPL